MLTVCPKEVPIICTLAAKCEQIYSDIFKRIKKIHKTFVAIGTAVTRNAHINIYTWFRVGVSVLSYATSHVNIVRYISQESLPSSHGSGLSQTVFSKGTN